MRSMRGVVSWSGALCLCLSGCFSTEGTPDGDGDEAQAVAEALTRKVDFENGTLLEGFLPDETDTEVQLVPLEESVTMSPGDTSLMGLDIDNPNEADDPIEATLIQFGKAAKDHVEVTRPGKGGEPVEGQPARVENHFTVQEDICDVLCNKRYAVKLLEAPKTQRGKVGRHVERTLILDCSELGDPERCPNGDEDDPGTHPVTMGPGRNDAGPSRDGGGSEPMDAGAAFDAGSAGSGGAGGMQGGFDAGGTDDPDAGPAPSDGGVDSGARDAGMAATDAGT